nr:PAS domain-containing hybrid sensor histidine kinase/response regulator [Limnobacter parvus]
MIEFVTSHANEFLDVLERALDGIWFWDIKEGNSEWMSPKFWTTFGYEPSSKKHLASEWQDLIFPEDLELAKVNIGKHLQAPLNPEFRYDQVVRYKTIDGDVRYIRCTGQAILDETGKPYRVLGLHTDLTEKIKAQEIKTSAEELRRLRGLAETLPQLTWTCTAKGDCDYLSPNWTDYTGATRSLLLGAQWFEFVHADDKQRLASSWQQSVTTGEPFKCDFRILGKDGIYRMFDTRALPLKNELGNIIAWFGSNTDIQDSIDYKVRLEREVAQKTEALKQSLELAEQQKKQAESLEMKAQAASLAKSRFLSTISHELRTPLNGISGLTYSLQLTSDPEKARTLLNQLSKATQHLNSLVSDVLEMGRIEEGRLQLNIQPSNLREVCETSLGIVGEAASHKGLEIRYEFDKRLPESALFDEVRLKQVLVNLLSNAVKFTETGFVKLSCRLSKRVLSDAEVLFQVEDTGVGIAEAKLEKIFEVFEQAENNTFSKYGGSGLGLGLVKGLITNMGGQYGVKTKLGTGSLFWVSLPLKVCAANVTNSATVGPPTKNWSGRHVLIVDDAKLNLLVLENVLSLNGAKVTKANDGLEAIQSLIGNPDIELVLMDVHMPQMDGLQATREIRGLHGPINNVRIIGLTGAAMEEDRRSALDAGMNEVMFKPISPEKLLAL